MIMNIHKEVRCYSRLWWVHCAVPGQAVTYYVTKIRNLGWPNACVGFLGCSGFLRRPCRLGQLQVCMVVLLCVSPVVASCSA